ncbi:MAG: hypothetical protein BroJett018_34240 [Chloroflexota bacterium]|nr:DUF1003 domain-containing protein [Chloroflexota bacterium]NOG64066.1 DUF1003 domain-containing protein [Chloroflexota bacterium]GIK65630.1 MAG: hypothetical protein BroJett018_34240 [Chloroflexota bacterium]
MYNDLLIDRLTVPVDDDDARIQVLIDEIEELESLLSPAAQDLIRDLRPRPVTDDVYEEIDETATFGERVADKMALFAGSWTFILSFGFLMAVWIGINGLMGGKAFDPFPFILLNLTLSTLAALQAPVILMAQNRQAEKDRAVAKNDYQVNLKNELEIADMHRKVDAMIEGMAMQTRLVNALVAARRQELSATVRLIETQRSNGHNRVMDQAVATVQAMDGVVQ